MKIASIILSLLLSDVKREVIYVELLFISLFIKVGWFMLVAFLSHLIKTFIYQHDPADRQLTGHLSLCY
jgi:hypothetical protein